MALWNNIRCSTYIGKNNNGLLALLSPGSFMNDTKLNNWHCEAFHPRVTKCTQFNALVFYSRKAGPAGFKRTTSDPQ